MIQVLINDYNRITREVTDLGFKGEILNLKIEVGKPKQVIDEEEKLFEKMMEKNAVASTGRLFKLGQ